MVDGIMGPCIFTAYTLVHRQARSIGSALYTTRPEWTPMNKISVMTKGRRTRHSLRLQYVRSYFTRHTALPFACDTAVVS